MSSHDDLDLLSTCVVQNKTDIALSTTHQLAVQYPGSQKIVTDIHLCR